MFFETQCIIKNVKKDINVERWFIMRANLRSKDGGGQAGRFHNKRVL